MIEIKIPKTLRQFGYKEGKNDLLRRTALLRASEIIGKENVLFNLSSLVVMTKPFNKKKFNIFRDDLHFFVKRIFKEEK